MNYRAMVTRLNLIDGQLRSVLGLESVGKATTLEEAIVNSAATTEQVTFGGTGFPAVASPVAQRLLIASLQAQVEARLLVGDASGAMLRSITDAIRRMKLAQSAQALQRQMCIELCRAVGFDSALISFVTADSFVPQTADQFGGIGMPLPRVVCAAEQDCVRFSRLVRAGMGDSPATEGYCELLGSTEYLVAPVVAKTKVVAIVHVCRVGVDITDHDYEALGMLLSLYSVLYERMLNSARVEQLRVSIIGAAAQLAEEVDRIAGAAISLEMGGEHVGGSTTPAPDVFTANLTNRERRVFERMVQGESNAQIARELVVSVETVKTHVKRILRKVGAANRLEAITLYVDGPERPGH
ncbi:LuxR family transcriptional regulator [Mycolicibacterium sp. lyk4-40-TYG-92]|uniref:helix-turn-helix transcriptional regulator n=1 Tax=Mycolicibacterium sp. lyk4-40-TYG-92 TaxID=3040295 RepID=UPI002551C238|nr:LuxR family transcriptional regulator [Mycolicibacterium sp. lyk4-40-TYG-92]